MTRLLIIAFMALSSLRLTAQDSFYGFTVKDISGKDYNFSQLKGKKVLIVNTASKCGFTPQYAGLQELYEKYKDKGLVVIGFPANNFANQEPGSETEIQEFCTSNYGVSFPMMSKISVKGDDIHPLYQWLTDKEKNGVEDSNVKWNFQKYLIGEDGKFLAYFSSRTKPMDEEILNYLD
jgi:glutathione peroxidase